jgi:hypothetical protein
MKHEHEQEPQQEPKPAQTETAPGASEAPEIETPELGTMVQYADLESNAVYPAMVIGVHVDATVDLRVHFGYGLGTHDRQNVKRSELGAAGTYLETLPKKERAAKIASAREKQTKEQEKAAAEAKAVREQQEKELAAR